MAAKLTPDCVDVANVWLAMLSRCPTPASSPSPRAAWRRGAPLSTVVAEVFASAAYARRVG